MTGCLLCPATTDHPNDWPTRHIPVDVVWTGHFDRTPVPIAQAGEHPVCPACATWLDGDRSGLPAGTLTAIGDALDAATTAGVTNHQTRRALREELVGQAHALAHSLT